MGEPRDTNRAHISPAAAKRVLVAMDAADLPAEPPGRGGPLPRIDGYIIERELGRGAGGVTYLAHKEGSEAKIALKVLHSRPGDGRASQRAWRELDTLQQVRVPSVPRLLDFGATDHSLYIATEYIEGTPLSDLYEHARPADLAEMRRRVHLLEKIARAAHALHERGVIHRDLKPSNVIVTRTSSAEGEDSVGEPFIIDLGIALIDTPDLHQTLTQDGQPVGTPAFMAPEQARGRREEISTRSDIYSLGAIGYWLCTGETPHDLTEVTLHEAIRRVGSEPPREARGISEAVPKGLGAVLGKACSERRDDRYGSAGDLAADALRWRRGQVVHAASPSLWVRAARWGAQHPLLTTTAACITLAVGILGGTAITLCYLNRRPFAVVLSSDRQIATLQALSGEPLYSWNAGEGCAFPYAELLTEPQTGLGRRLLALQQPVRTGQPNSGYRITLIDPDRPGSVRWSATLTLQAPSAGSMIASGEYIPRKALVEDVFSEVPGHEIVQSYQHSTTFFSAIAIFNCAGELLYQAFQWGPLGDILWVPDDGILILLAQDWQHPWSVLGVDESTPAHPLVLTALRPSLSTPSLWLSGPAASSPTDQLWYRCVKPPNKPAAFRPALALTDPGVHPDALFDLVWHHRASDAEYHSTIGVEGWTLKSWDRRDYDHSSISLPGSAATLGYLPTSPEECAGFVAPRADSQELDVRQYPPALSHGLLAHWSFDDPSNLGRDVSGAGNDLLIPGARHSIPGPVGSAIRFLELAPPSGSTNTSTMVQAPHCSTKRLPYPGAAGFSVAAWLYLDTADECVVVQDYEPHVACSPVFQVAYRPELSAINFDLSHEFSSPTRLEALVPNTMTPCWIHVVGVYEPAPLPIMRLFLDGEEVAARRMEGPMRAFDRPSAVYVAGSWHSTIASSLDDVRLYDRALRTSEIRMLALPDLSPQQ